VAAAARDVLVPVLGSFSFFLPANCVSAGIASVEADYAAALGAIPNGTAKTRGIALGGAAAAAILALRSADGFDTPTVDPNYQEGSAPGEYRYTPGTPFAFAPNLGEDLTPFVLKDGSQFRPGPPYPLTSRKYAADVNEVQRLGGDDVTTPSARTDDQTEIALFWVDTSPLMWNRIARATATAEGLDLWESARLFGLLNLAMTDGYIGTFEAKYHYRFWRPVTAIRLADIDGNPATTADPTWTPLVETPPIPDYDSGHAVEGGTASQVLKRFFHTDTMSFSACSLTLPAGQTCSDVSPTLRHFTSFSQAANENAVSRIYVGFHFRDAVETGTNTARRSATAPSTTSCSPYTKELAPDSRCSTNRLQWHRVATRGRPDALEQPVRLLVLDRDHCAQRGLGRLPLQREAWVLSARAMISFAGIGSFHPARDAPGGRSANGPGLTAHQQRRTLA